MICDFTDGDRGRCSSHGYFCVSPIPGCICDKGWTGKSRITSYVYFNDECRVLNCFFCNIYSIAGLGDFASTTGLDCDINETSTTVLSCCVLFSSFCSIALISRFLVVRSVQKTTLCYISSDPKMIFPWIFLFQLWSQVAFAITKLMHRTDELVGKTLLASLFVEISVSLAFLGLVVYFLVILKFLKSFADMLVEDRRIRLIEYFATLKILCCLIPIMTSISSYMVVIGIKYPEHQKTLALASLSAAGFLTLLYGYLITSALKYLRRELVNHISVFVQTSDGVRLVLKRLTLAYYILLVMSFLMGVSYFIFCTDYLLRKSTYLILWLHISWPPVSTALILTVSQISNRVEPGGMEPGSVSESGSCNVYIADTPHTHPHPHPQV